MIEQTRAGRHRSSGYNPLSEISGIVARAGEHGARASAVLAASGGLVAAFAMPAQAAPVTTRTATATSASTLSTAKGASTKVAAAKVKAAVVAPKVTAPVATESFGLAGVKAVAKPKPRPVVVQSRVIVSSTRATQAVSRSAGRTAVAAPAAAAAPAPRASSSAVVNAARALIGVPYVWGGESMGGVDCSGMVLLAHRAVGVSLPHSSSAQANMTTRVSNPVPGDLVFWGYPAWHVAIYSGNGMSVEASTRQGRVVERPLWGSYYFGRL